MSNALICDSCDKPITDLNDRVSILVYTAEAIADPQLDLCGQCGDALRSDAKVKKARERAMKRIKNWRAPAVPASPTGAPPDDYEPQLGDGPARRGDVTEEAG